jgi:Tol biopolymer transport system component
LTSRGGDWRPSWSPDREWIAYDNVRQHTWIMRADGTEPQSIGEEGGEQPRWHPLEPLIVHIRFPTDECGAADLFVMDGRRGWLYGTRMERIGYDDATPEYSPDGQRVAFSSYRNGCERPDPGEDLKWHIWVMNADGTEARQFTRNPGHYPSWSPDGSKIVYIRQDWYINTPENGVLWVLDVASGEESQLTFKWQQRCSTSVSDVSWTDLKRRFR